MKMWLAGCAWVTMSAERVPLRAIASADDVPALLRQIRDELHRLNATMAQRFPARSQTISSDDRERLAVLLNAIVACWGPNRIFAVGELMAFASELEARRVLRTALERIGTSRRIGMFLRKMAGTSVDNLKLERVGGDRSGSILIVRECET